MMPLTDPNDVVRTTDHWRGRTIDFSSTLAAAFDGCLDAVDLTDAEAAYAVLALHGQGREESGLELETVTGLVVKVTDGVAWILGRRVAVTTTDGFTLVSIPATAATFVYMDDDGVFHTSAGALTGVDLPTDYVFLGTATANSSDCTAVDMTDADLISSIASVSDQITAINALIVLLRAAVGEDYMGSSPPAQSLDARVAAIVAATGALVYGSTIEWSSIDARLLGVVIQDYIDASISTHETTYHSGGSSGEGGASVEPQWYDWPIINVGLQALRLTEFVDPDILGEMKGVVGVVWGVYGDGSDGTPNYIDETNSTWTG